MTSELLNNWRLVNRRLLQRQVKVRRSKKQVKREECETDKVLIFFYRW